MTPCSQTCLNCGIRERNEMQELQIVDLAIWLAIYFAYCEKSSSSGIKHFRGSYYLPTYLPICPTVSVGDISSLPLPQLLKYRQICEGMGNGNVLSLLITTERTNPKFQDGLFGESYGGAEKADVLLLHSFCLWGIFFSLVLFMNDFLMLVLCESKNQPTNQPPPLPPKQQQKTKPPNKLKAIYV